MFFLSNASLLIPNIFNFLVLLSYERYHTKTIIQMPKVIQLCDGIMASGQDPTTHGNVNADTLCSNKHQSHLVEGRITVYTTPLSYSPGGSSNLQVHVLAGGLTPNFPSRRGWRIRDPHLTQCVIGPHKCTCQVASKSVNSCRVHECDRPLTDRQTDHDTEKCVAIGRSLVIEQFCLIVCRVTHKKVDHTC